MSWEMHVVMKDSSLYSDGWARKTFVFPRLLYCVAQEGVHVVFEMCFGMHLVVFANML